MSAMAAAVLPVKTVSLFIKVLRGNGLCVYSSYNVIMALSIIIFLQNREWLLEIINLFQSECYSKDNYSTRANDMFFHIAILH